MLDRADPLPPPMQQQPEQHQQQPEQHQQQPEQQQEVAPPPGGSGAEPASPPHPSVALLGRRAHVFTREGEEREAAQRAAAAAAAAAGGGGGAEVDDAFYEFTEGDLRAVMAGQAARRAREAGAHLMTKQVRVGVVCVWGGGGRGVCAHVWVVDWCGGVCGGLRVHTHSKHATCPPPHPPTHPPTPPTARCARGRSDGAPRLQAPPPSACCCRMGTACRRAAGAGAVGGGWVCARGGERAGAGGVHEWLLAQATGECWGCRQSCSPNTAPH